MKHKILKILKNRLVGRFPHLSYSRSGEDLIIEEILGVNQFKGFFVDVGAFHPINYSNTYKFYMKGWRGINIDPNYDVIAQFKRERTEDININIAIGGEPGEMTYYSFNEDSSMNTISEEFAQKYIGDKTLTVKEKIKVPVDTLGGILEKNVPANTAIDFLSIDAEGMDFIILQTNNWQKFRPKLIIIETNDSLAEVNSSKISQFLSAFNYKPVAYSLVTLDAGNVYYIDQGQFN